MSLPATLLLLSPNVRPSLLLIVNLTTPMPKLFVMTNCWHLSNATHACGIVKGFVVESCFEHLVLNLYIVTKIQSYSSYRGVVSGACSDTNSSLHALLASTLAN